MKTFDTDNNRYLRTKQGKIAKEQESVKFTPYIVYILYMLIYVFLSDKKHQNKVIVNEMMNNNKNAGATNNATSKRKTRH